MKLQIAKGSTSQIITVFIQDNTATDGSGLGSLDQTSSITGGSVRAGGTGVALNRMCSEGTGESGVLYGPTKRELWEKICAMIAGIQLIKRNPAPTG